MAPTERDAAGRRSSRVAGLSDRSCRGSSRKRCAATPRKEDGPRLRILVVAGEGGSAGGVLQNLRQWADDGQLEVDAAPDLPRAVRQLAGRRWDVVLAVLGDHPDDDLSWWVDSLR